MASQPEPAPVPSPPPPHAGALTRRIAANAGVLAVTYLLVRALGMGLMIVLARYLGAEGYGTYQRSEAFVFLFSVLANLGLDMILTREVAARSPRVPEYLGGVFALKFLLGAIALAVVYGVAGARGYTGEFLWGIRIFGLILLVNSLSQVMDAVFQGLEVMGYLAITNLVAQLASVALGVSCILLGKDLRWVLGSLLVSNLLRLGLSALLLARLQLTWARPRLATLGFLLREAFPLAFAASFVIVYQQVDAVMLGEMKGNAEVGWYKAGAKFLLLFTVLRESFLLAVYPVFSSLARTQRERLGSLLTRAARYQVVVALYFVLCFVFLPRIAPKLLGADFQNSGAVLPVLAWILVPQTLSITAGRALVAAGCQSRMMFSTGMSLAVNIAGNLLLIPRYGFLGAAAASVVSEIVVASLNLYYVNRFVARTQVVRALAKPSLAALIAGGALYFVRDLRMVAAVPISALVYLGVLLALRTFSHDEILQFRSLVASGMARLDPRRSGTRWAAPAPPAWWKDPEA